VQLDSQGGGKFTFMVVKEISNESFDDINENVLYNDFWVICFSNNVRIQVDVIAVGVWEGYRGVAE
jgi:hypothetical protein